MENTITKIFKDPNEFKNLKDEQSVDLALLAVTRDYNALRIIPEKFQTYQICKIALKIRPSTLQDVKAPTQRHYKAAILYSNGALYRIRDMIPALEMNLKVLKHILKHVENEYSNSSKTEMCGSWLNKFPTNAWTDSIVTDILTTSSSFPITFVNFILKKGVPLGRDARRKIFQVGNNEILNSLNFDEFTEEDLIWALSHKYYFPENLTRGWISRLNLSPIDFYKAKNKPIAFRLCKEPTADMMIISALYDTRLTIHSCFEKRLFTGSSLTELIVALRQRQLDGYTQSSCCHVDKLQDIFNSNELQQLHLLNLTIDQLQVIRSHDFVFYDYLKEHNIYVMNHCKVIIFDKINRTHCEMLNWSFSSEIAILKEQNNGTVTFSTKSHDVYKFYLDGSFKICIFLIIND